MSDLMLDVSQAHELKLAFRRADYTNEEIKRLCEGAILVDVRKVLLGHARIVPVEHVITCTCGSFLPRLGSGWSEEEHHLCGTMQLEKRDGHLFLNGKKVERYFSPNQKGSKVIQGHNLRKELANQSTLCACVLDYLIQHIELIPEEWKQGVTYFWGTIFRDPDGDLSVAYLCWYGGRWDWDCIWLDGGWGSDGPAARLASK